MTDKKLLIAVLVLLASNIFCVAGWNRSISQVDEYHAYYKATEALLDTLENEYSWKMPLTTMSTMMLHSS